MTRPFGAIVTERISHPHAISAKGADMRYNRHSMFSQNVHPDDVDDALVLIYASAKMDHESYTLREVNGQPGEFCREWDRVYRYVPSVSTPEGAKALQALLNES